MPEGASSQLQDYFEREKLENQDLEEYTSTVLCYIQNCVDNVTVIKIIWVYPNQKGVPQPEEQKSPQRPGDRALYSANIDRAVYSATRDRAL